MTIMEPSRRFLTFVIARQEILFQPPYHALCNTPDERRYTVLGHDNIANTIKPKLMMVTRTLSAFGPT
jgi:hypothetical protein